MAQNKEKKDKRKTSQRMLYDDARIKHKFKVNGNLFTLRWLMSEPPLIYKVANLLILSS